MWPQEDTGGAGGETGGAKSQARGPPRREASVTWEHLEWGESGRARDQRDVPGVRHSGTLGGPTIFRPMYSQPGLTDSRKAFL